MIPDIYHMAAGDASQPRILREGATAFTQRFFGVTGSCPGCGLPFRSEVRQRFLAGRRVKCTCGWRGTWRVGTALEGSPLSAAEFVALLLGLIWSVHPAQIAAQLGVHPDTVTNWRDRLQHILRRQA